MSKRAPLTLAVLMSVSLWCGSALGLPLGTLVHDGPATPEQLSLFLPVTGSLPQSATATVRYKPSSSGTFITGHPMYRIRTDLFNETPATGSISAGFAWPIIDLQPGTSYDVEVTVCSASVCDIKTGTFTTRALPSACGAATTTIAAGASAATINAALAAANPGNVIQLASGTYNLSGTSLNITRSGTQGSPICIRGASRTGTVLNSGSAIDIFRLASVNDVILENMTLNGSFIDAGPAGGGCGRPSNNSLGIRFNDATTSARVTIRNIVMNGVDRAVGPAVTAAYTMTQLMVYNNTFIGNNVWTAADTDSNCSWDDDGIMLAGIGNVAFNNTLAGFGDVIAYASTASSATLTQSIANHAYRNDILHTEDDSPEADHAVRNNTFYDNRILNSMTCLSLDPLYAGPFLYARNICLNTGRQPFKFNSAQTGAFVYNSTFVHTTTRYNTSDPPAESGWYQANNGTQTSHGYRNNILIYRGSGTRTTRIDNDTASWRITDWSHNSWFPNATFQFPEGAFANLAAAQAGSPATTPIFTALTSRMQQDNITVTNPFTSTLTLGADYHTQLTAAFVPTLAAGSAPKNSGVVIPNITDGFTGSAPDRGAIIGGQTILAYGDVSDFSAVPPAAPTNLRLTLATFMATVVGGVLIFRGPRRKR